MPILPDRLLTEVGRVAAHAAELDMVTAALWATTTGEAPADVDEVPWIVKIAGGHIPTLRSAIAKAAESLASDQHAAVLGWLDGASALMAERDRIIHALWLGELEDGRVVQHGWHGRSGAQVVDDPGIWRELAMRLGGWGAAGSELIDAIEARQ